MVACRMCGRTLTTKASRRLGIGPECQAKVKAAEIRNAPDGVYSGGDIVCRRDIFGAHVNVPYVSKLQNYGRDLSWGSPDSNAADLALNILLRFIPYRKALQRHQYFKFKFVDTLPYEGGVIKEKSIREFLKETGATP